MIEQVRGKLVLDAIPTPEVAEKTSALLVKYFKNVTPEKLFALFEKTPVVLTKNISQKAGQTIADNLNNLGASASFVPEEQGTKEGSPINPVGAYPDKMHNSSPDNLSHLFTDEKAPRKKDRTWQARLMYQLEIVNKELWLVLSMIAIVGVMNYLLTAHHMMLGLYTLPTLLSAYLYGRRHATLTAVASICIVGLVVYNNPALLVIDKEVQIIGGRWFEIFTWGAILIVTAYAMGTLYERDQVRLRELRKAYRGLIIILRHFIAKDKYTENHCYRVSIYAAKIAAYLKMNDDQIENVRSAALLHDLGKLDLSREILYKAAQLSREEFDGMKQHVDRGAQMLEAADTPLNRIIPIILAHHEKFDGSGYHGAQAGDIPLEARIIAVADVYDALASDRPYRKAMTPFEVKEQIVKGAGTEFDPVVVEAFLKAFKNGEMDIPDVIV